MKQKCIMTTAIAWMLFSSCAQNQYPSPETSEIKHSSPGVISLHEAEREKNARENNGRGVLGWLLDGLIGGMLGSDPDDDLFDSGRKRNSGAGRDRFISRNEDSFRSSLENKKQ